VGKNYGRCWPLLAHTFYAISTIVPVYVGTIVPSNCAVNGDHEGVADFQKPESLTLEQAIGRVLLNLRSEKDLNQVDVAAATNFGVRSIRTMEHGRQSMTIRSLDALAMFYCIPIEEIIIRAKRLRDETL
jgi:Na+-transporting NADH:ubiquinone oxidoreductase subunit NqrD